MIGSGCRFADEKDHRTFILFADFASESKQKFIKKQLIFVLNKRKNVQ